MVGRETRSKITRPLDLIFDPPPAQLISPEQWAVPWCLGRPDLAARASIHSAAGGAKINQSAIGVSLFPSFLPTPLHHAPSCRPPTPSRS